MIPGVTHSLVGCSVILYRSNSGFLAYVFLGGGGGVRFLVVGVGTEYIYDSLIRDRHLETNSRCLSFALGSSKSYH